MVLGDDDWKLTGVISSYIRVDQEQRRQTTRNELTRIIERNNSKRHIISLFQWLYYT
jgi:hypothetical protein